MRNLDMVNTVSFPYGKMNALKRSIIVSAGIENNSDSASNGERTRNRSNRIPFRNIGEMWCLDSCRASLVKSNISGMLNHRG